MNRSWLEFSESMMLRSGMHGEGFSEAGFETDDEPDDLDDPSHGAFDDVYKDLMLALANRLFGDDQEIARSMLEAGSFLMDGMTVVMRLDRDTDMVEFFCDVGLPDDHSRESSFRRLLEINLCRTYPGLVFGVHPNSGRIVASSAMHVLLLADVEVGLQILLGMVRCVSDLIEERLVMLQ